MRWRYDTNRKFSSEATEALKYREERELKKRTKHLSKEDLFNWDKQEVVASWMHFVNQ